MAEQNDNKTPHIVVRGGADSFKQEIIAGALTPLSPTDAAATAAKRE